jgi:SAM-dependent methyltransferase
MLFLRRHTDLFSDSQKSLLHLAPEWYLQKYFRRHGTINYLSGDLHSPRAMMRMDITDLGFPDGSFDVILCSHVLEHVTDDKVAMRELFRVLKPGGWGILDVPVDWSRADTFEDWSASTPSERRRVFGQEDHVRIYGRTYPDLLRQVGFQVEVDQYEISAQEVRRFGLRPGIDHIWMCRKPA